MTSFQSLADADLVTRVAQRDRAAFEYLYDRHASHAMGLALKILHNEPIAEEIVQEAFWRVWKRATTFDAARGNFTTWLLGIVHNLAIDKLRRLRAAPATLEIDDIERNPTGDIADDAQNVVEQAWASMQSADMRRAMAKLPEAQRVVIELAFFEGLSRQEIAQRLDEPLGTIHTRARLGLMKLKDLLSDPRVSEQ